MVSAMSTPRPWTVNHPGPLTARGANVWTIDDLVPRLGVPRTMTVVRRSDGGLVFFNAVPVPDATLDALRALGRPAQLILPNQYHALDAAAFVEKLGVTAYSSAAGVEALRERLPVQPVSALPTDAALQLFEVEGFRTGEVVLFAHGALVVGDLFTNVPHLPGLRGLLMRMVGFTGPAPRLPKPVQKRVGRDLKGVGAQLRTLAELKGLELLVPSHGAVVQSGAAEALRSIALTLPQ